MAEGETRIVNHEAHEDHKESFLFFAFFVNFVVIFMRQSGAWVRFDTSCSRRLPSLL